jgi:hypothetical protein
MIILNYYASINRGLSSQVLSAYPNIVAVPRLLRSKSKRGADRLKPSMPDVLNPN